MRHPSRTSPGFPITPQAIDTLVRSLSIEERAHLTTGRDAWHANGAESLGLRPMLTLDGPNGVRGPVFPPGSSATCTPCGTALGATWDIGLVAEVAARIGSEAKRAGVDYLLAPTLNIVRSPLAGRDFECYSEDPLLVAEMAVAFVAGVQSQGVAACPKHLVANESETHRMTVSCVVDERALREVYLPPFEAVARAGAWSMMAAYNRLNGAFGCENGPLIDGIVRGEWGWDGVVMSDWGATNDTLASAAAGLDLEMPGPPKFFGRALAAAVRRGEVDEDTLNAAARRILTLAARVGALTLPGADGPVAAAPAKAPELATPQLLSDPDAAALVRRTAAESFVLLANDGTLPLAPAGLRRIAVIGPNATRPCTQGGGAANIDAPNAVTPLEGLRAALPAAVQIVHESGCENGPRLVPAHETASAVAAAGAPALAAGGAPAKTPALAAETAMTAAVAAAAAADIAIVVVGNEDGLEAERRDRQTVALAGRQDELVERVAAANRRTVVVVNAGCPMDLPWAEKVAAVVYAWLPGQEFGNALADVLLGVVEPGGRLPVTLARRAADYPAYDTTPDQNDELVYREGVNVGYRGLRCRRSGAALRVRPRPRVHHVRLRVAGSLG
jgi:beta-glucosidase